MATAIKLADDVQAYVDSLVEAGLYRSPDEAVDAELRNVRHDRFLALRRSVERARDQIGRGEGREAAQVFDELRERYRSWPR